MAEEANSKVSEIIGNNDNNEKRSKEIERIFSNRESLQNTYCFFVPLNQNIKL